MLKKTTINKKLFIILSIITFLLLSSMCFGATYYVDATNGNDNYNGLSNSTAWKTIAKVNSSKFVPDDFILFKRGEIWREQLIVPSSGSHGKPITFMAYGSGDKPVISGADLMTGWNAYSGNIWQKIDVTTEPKIIFLGGTLGNKQASLRAVDSRNDWFWSGNILYVYSETDPDGAIVVEAGQRTICIVAVDKDYITIDSLSVKYANSFNIQNTRGNEWIVSNNTSLGSYWHGILYLGHTDDDLPIVGGEIYGNTLSSATASNSGLIKAQGTTDVIIRNNTITSLSSGGAIVTSSGNDTGGGATSSGTQIYQNDISGATAGIIVKYTSGAYVYRNKIYDGSGLGIGIAFSSTGAYVYSNLIYNLTATATLWNGIDINGGSTNGFAYNNTIYKVAGFCLTMESDIDESDGWTVKNNIFDSSVNTDVNGVNASIYIGAGVDGYTIDRNLFQINDAIALFQGGATTTVIATWNALTGVGTDFLDDPLMTDAAGDDFTLQATSPCIDAGVNVGLNLDYLGNGLSGSAWDIGAYEFKKIAPIKNLRLLYPSSK